MKKLTQQIITLRQRGATYNEICARLGCSKGNVSYVCTKYVPDNAEHTGRSRRAAAPTTATLAAMRVAADKYYGELRAAAEARWLAALQGVPPDFRAYCAGLFDGEGNHHGTHANLTNSDPDIILCWLRLLKLVGAPCKIVLQLHASHSRKNCLNFWLSAGVSVDTIYQHDTRPAKQPARFNHGTITVCVIKPLGFRAALSRFSFSREAGLSQLS